MINRRYEIQVIVNTIVSNNVTNTIHVNNRINYYTNTSIETNFDDYFVTTNEFDNTIDVGAATITYSNVVYYYSNLLYTLLYRDLGVVENSYFITFYSNGVVKSGVLFGNRTIFGVNYGVGTGITFYSNGNISNGILNGAQTIQGKDYIDGSQIVFDIEGNIVTN